MKKILLLLLTISFYKQSTFGSYSPILIMMSELGYKIDKGQCYGVAHMAVQAALRGDSKKFQQRMEDIRT